MKGVFNIMKINKITKIIIAFMAVVILSSLTVTAFAETGTEVTTETYSFKRGEKKNHPVKQDGDWFEDWFENRIEARKHNVDFSQLPEDATDKEILDFFRNNFLGKAPEQKNEAKPERPAKKDRKADRFEDFFEDRIDAREHRVDFSQLGEDPTDEEIVEFFKNNFMGEGSAWVADGEFNEEAMKDYSFNECGKPFGGHKEQRPKPQFPLNPLPRLQNRHRKTEQRPKPQFPLNPLPRLQNPPKKAVKIRHKPSQSFHVLSQTSGRTTRPGV